jgi:hypothetical protein
MSNHGKSVNQPAAKSRIAMSPAEVRSPIFPLSVTRGLSVLKSGYLGRSAGRLSFFVILLAGFTSAIASQSAFIPAGGIGSANEGPGPVNLGMVFTPTQNIQVESLGFYFDTGLGNSEVVGLYNIQSQSLLASTTVSSANPTAGSYLYSAITPVLLVPGQQYVVDELVSGSLWEYGNVPTTNPGITYNGHDYLYGSQLAFPNSTVNAAGSAYFGPNFTYSPVVVPEPGTCAPIAFGLCSLLVMTRRKMNSRGDKLIKTV